MKISDYLDEHLVLALDVSTRDEALGVLVDALAMFGKLDDRQAFFSAILDREKIVSTGVGMGIAIPHAKLPSFTGFFIAIGIHRQGIEWDALDGGPVRLIFMIGGPDDKQTEYLRILSSLTSTLRDEELRKKLLQISAPKEIISLFSGI